MNRNQPERFSLLQSPKTNAIFIGETPEQVIGAARVYDQNCSIETREEPNYPSFISPTYKIILGGVTDNGEFMRAISGSREARDEFEREVGPGSKVRQIVHLARNAQVFLDEEHEERFRDFAKRAYRRHESGKLESAWGFEGLYAFSLNGEGSGVNKVLSQYRLPRDSGELTASDFLSYRADKIFLPKNLMDGVVAAGLRYRNNEMTLEQRRNSTGAQKPGLVSKLRALFG